MSEQVTEDEKLRIAADAYVAGRIRESRYVRPGGFYIVKDWPEAEWHLVLPKGWKDKIAGDFVTYAGAGCRWQN